MGGGEISTIVVHLHVFLLDIRRGGERESVCACVLPLWRRRSCNRHVKLIADVGWDVWVLAVGRGAAVGAVADLWVDRCTASQMDHHVPFIARHLPYLWPCLLNGVISRWLA